MDSLKFDFPVGGYYKFYCLFRKSGGFLTERLIKCIWLRSAFWMPTTVCIFQMSFGVEGFPVTRQEEDRAFELLQLQH